MSKSLAEFFLNEYNKKINPLLDLYLQNKIKDASKVDNLPADLLKKFSEIAKRGKKIRGALVVLGYQIAGGKDLKSIYETSIFIELVHAGLLVHDDIIDQDNLRRGISTIHNQYLPSHFGQSMAILAGDLAFYLSWEKLLNGKFSEEYLLRAGKIYGEYINRVIYGQVLDVANTKLTNLSEEKILKIMRFKTAEYTGLLPLLIGAIFGGLKDGKKLKALKEYGLCLGWVFQIQDDILGLYGNDKITGKSFWTDLKQSKITLFIPYFLKHCTIEQSVYFKKILGNKNTTGEDAIFVQKLFKETGSYDYVVKLGWNYINKGKKIINSITDDEYIQKLLESLLIFMMERVK